MEAIVIVSFFLFVVMSLLITSTCDCFNMCYDMHCVERDYYQEIEMV